MSDDDGALVARGHVIASRVVGGRARAVGLLQIDCAVASGCPRCARGEGCGQGLWGRRNGPVRLEMAGDSALHGRPVELTLSARRVLGAAGLAYGLPLAGTVAGSLAGAAAGEGAAVAGAVLGLVLGFACARALARRWRGLLQPSLRSLS